MFICNKRLISVLLKTLEKPLTLIRQRLFLCLFIIPITLLSACSSFRANAYNYSITPENINSRFMRTNILSSFLIKAKTYNNLPITEFSDIAWDEDEKLLYAVSDEGLLYHLKINIIKNKLKTVDIVFATELKNKQKQALKGKFSDAEGLVVKNGNNGKLGDSTLIISFENKPRINSYSINGNLIKKVKTVKKLGKRKYFRHNNKALESVTIHPKYGILTASELPLKSKAITSPVVISLRKLNLDKCNTENLCEIVTIAKFDSSDGWILDNFEGLTRLRDNQYLMVSDNNNNPLQKTLLVLFEVLDK